MARPRVDALVQDLHSALRRLRRAPGLCALVISSLALGVGASTAIFSVGRAVIFEPVPYRHSERVVHLNPYVHNAPGRFSEEQALTIREHARSLERLEAYSFARLDWRRGDSTVRLLGREVTPGLPAVMEMPLVVGRSFTGDDGRPGSAPVVLISEEFWRREFGGVEDVVGRSLTLGDISRTVVGVARRPESRLEVDAWVPRALNPTGDWSPSLVAWLRPGVSIDEARAEFSALSAALAVRPGSMEVQL